MDQVPVYSEEEENDLVGIYLEPEVIGELESYFLTYK
jgi:hypothetical protein